MAKNLKEQYELRGKAFTDARALVDAADGAKRPMSDDEERQYNCYMDDIKRFDAEIKREQELLEVERRMAGDAIGKVAGGVEGVATPDSEARSIAFRKLIVEGLGALSHEEHRSLVTGSDTQAGFLNAPQEFVQQLVARVKNQVFIEAMSTGHTTTNANGLGYPTLENDVDDFQMISEITTAPEDKKISFGRREFKPHLSKKLIKISDKMLRADGMNPEAIVLDRAGYKFGVLKENKYMIGTGNQEPLGLFVASPKGIDTDRDFATDMDTGANGFNFTPDALKGVKYNMKSQYMTTASWLFHRDGVAKIAKLKTGDGYYMFEFADQVGAIDQLLGRPLVMSEYAPNTFTANQYVGMFGDFKWYYTVNSLALRIKRLNELFAATSEVGFLFEAEFDGMPVLSEAFTRIKTAAA